MKSIARITTRMQGDGDGLFVGVCLKSNDFFKPNTVYEVVECLGEITIREVGKARGLEKGEDPKQANFMKRLFHWAVGIERALTDNGSVLFLSRDEYDSLPSIKGE